MSATTPRVIVIDHNVIDQILRGNAEAATALRTLRQNHKVYVTPRVYKELVQSPAIPRTAVIQKLIIEELCLERTGEIPDSVYNEVLKANTLPSGAKIASEEEAAIIAEARWLGAEVWSFDRVFRRNSVSVLKWLKVKTARESRDIPMVTGQQDYRVARRLLGLPPLEISLEGEVRSRVSGLTFTISGVALGLIGAYLRGLTIEMRDQRFVRDQMEWDINPEIMRQLQDRMGRIAEIQASGRQAYANVTLTSETTVSPFVEGPDDDGERTPPVLRLNHVRVTDNVVDQELPAAALRQLGYPDEGDITNGRMLEGKTYSIPVTLPPEAVDRWRDLEEELQTYAEDRINPTFDPLSRLYLNKFESDAKRSAMAAFGSVPEAKPDAGPNFLPRYLDADNLRPAGAAWPNGKAHVHLSPEAEKVLSVMVLGQAMTYRDIVKKSGLFIYTVILAIEELFAVGKVVRMHSRENVEFGRVIKMFP
jgi:hypothetical protein